MALFWHFFVLVLSIAVLVLVLVIDTQRILDQGSRDTIEFHRHPS